MDLVIDHNKGSYKRFYDKNKDKIIRTMNKLYGAKTTTMFTSGMNAIYHVLNLICEKVQSGVILYGNQLYCETRSKIISTLSKKYLDIKFVTFKMQNSTNLKNSIKKFKKSLKCIFFEACSNPSGFMIDWDILNDKPNDCYVIADNTWLTPIILNPFTYNVDIVIDSCSKYLSTGKCIAGVVMCKNITTEQSLNLNKMVKVMGIHVSPYHCKLIHEGLGSLENIINILSKKTKIVLDLLKKIKKIDKILHPCLTDHPTYSIYSKYIENDLYPSVIYFHVKSNVINGGRYWSYKYNKIASECNLNYLTSFGKPYDLVDRWPKKDKSGVWFRLSLGYDGIECNELIFNLKKFIKKV